MSLSASPPPQDVAHPGWVWVPAAGMTAAAAALLIAVVTISGDDPVADTTVPWLVLLTAFALAERFTVSVHYPHATHTVTPVEALIAIGLFTTGPLELIGAQLLGTAVVIVGYQRRRAAEAYWSLALGALGTSVTLMIFHLLGAGQADEPSGYLPAILAIIVADQLTGTLLARTFRRTTGVEVPLLRTPALIRLGLLTAVPLAMIGVAAAILIDEAPAAVPLLALPLAVMQNALGRYATERQRAQRVTLVYGAMRRLQQATTLEAAVSQLLRDACALFRADRAEAIVLPAGADETPRRIAVLRTDPTATITPIDEAALAADPLWHEDSWLLAAAHGRTQHVFGFEVRDAIGALLGRGDRRLGAIVVEDRTGGLATFTAEDLELLETFLAHATVTLDNSRLADSLAVLDAERAVLEQQALTDDLTGLPNRRAFMDRLTWEFHSASSHCAAAFIDVDDLKRVNDSLGHDAGDAVLREVGRRLQRCVSSRDLAARIAGDEFAILLPQAGHESELLAFAEQLEQAFHDPMPLNGGWHELRASVGLVLWPVESTEPSAMLGAADAAMYRAKAAGKGQVFIVTPEHTRQEPRRAA